MNPERMDDATRAELLNAEIDGVASEAQRAALAELLQRDPSAREELEALRAVADRGFRPNLVVAAGPEGGASRVPLLQERHGPDDGAAAFLCERFACLAPVSDPAALEALLDAS